MADDARTPAVSHRDAAAPAEAAAAPFASPSRDGATGVREPDPLCGLHVADGHLARVLRGEELLVQDGAMGTQLQARGLARAGEVPDLLCLTNPDAITDIHRGYVRAGAQMVTTNTFGANAFKLEGRASVAEVCHAAVRCARAAGARYVAGSIGPTGALLEPLGTLSFSEAYEAFAEQARALAEAGADVITLETMADLREVKAALLAARECTSLPVFASMTYGEDGRTFLGTPPEVAAALLSSMGAQAVGVNCSLGPDELLPVVRRLVRASRCPVAVRPNAGMPRLAEGRTVYDVHPDDFARAVDEMLDEGVGIVGGCCGTDPSFIERLAEAARRRQGRPVPRPYRAALRIASAQEAVELPCGQERIAVIGERINPTGKPKLAAALRAGDMDYLVGEAVAQREAGADVLDVNVGLPDADEAALLAAAVERLQATVTTPLVIDSSDPDAVEAAVRGYAGKPLINSVNGKRESLEAVLPLAKKYGCSVIGLTLDEEGIPPTAEGRLRIARRIVRAAEELGIPREDVVIDCLVMAAATNQSEVREILRAVALVKGHLGVRTALGVSNVSFGLPQRGMVNAAFLAAAFGVGLDLPLLNPLAGRYRDTVAAFKVLNGQDAGAMAFIEGYAGAIDPYAGGAAGAACAPSAAGASDAPGAPAALGGSGARATAPAAPGGPASHAAAASGTPAACAIAIPEALADAADEVRQMAALIMAGRKDPLPAATARLLEKHPALEVVDGVFIPALDEAGARFERGEFFLPQLMASAEAVKAGFDVVKARMEADAAADPSAAARAAAARRVIAVATVKGDIHDIGKNIVKMLLENYGYQVVDLGRDVAPDEVLREVKRQGIRLVGLSALMTTTVKAMEETIRLLRAEAPEASVFVGGAVLTAEYARRIGADYYGKDAAEAARIAERFFAEHPA